MNRHIFLGVHNIISANPKVVQRPSAFYEFLGAAYAAAAVMAVPAPD